MHFTFPPHHTELVEEVTCQLTEWCCHVVFQTEMEMEMLPTQGSAVHLPVETDKRPICNPNKIYGETV